MALRHAVLAALTDKEATGYELSKLFNISVANFWPATSQQIYRELDRLEKDGQLTSRLVEQTSRPNKRIFSVTDIGSQELDGFIESSSRPTAIRDDLLVKVVALEEDNTEAVASAVTERKMYTLEKLEVYEDLKTVILAGRGEAEYLAGEGRIGNYLVLLRGISFERDNLAWCEKVLTVLADRTRPGS